MYGKFNQSTNFFMYKKAETSLLVPYVARVMCHLCKIRHTFSSFACLLALVNRLLTYTFLRSPILHPIRSQFFVRQGNKRILPHDSTSMFKK
jgi:hypothetical protein